MKRARGLRVAAAVVGALAASATSHAQPMPEDAVEQQQTHEETAPEPARRTVHDPWEEMNRGIFTFNDYLDRFLLEPVAIGWDTVVPEPAERGLANFFANAASPRRIANDLFQGKLDKAGNDFGRFLINSSFGFLGFFDPATAQGIPPGNEDFGQTLGVWGTPAGPYLVLPFFGPSSPRDTAGLVVDTLLSPEFYFAPWYVSTPVTTTRVINARALALETVRAEREAAFDLYSAVRSAYVQYRVNQVRDREAVREDQDADESLYDLEEEE